MATEPQRSKKILNFSLIENARSFIIEALSKAIAAEKTPPEWKFAILHLVQAIELSLKELLKAQHPILIYKNVDKPKFTVSLEEALIRLKQIASFEPTKEEVTALEFAANVRNEIVHHEFKADPAELKAAFARLFGFLADFHRTHMDFPLEEKIPKALWLDGLKIKAYGEELFRRAKVRLDAEQLDDSCMIECPKCGWRALTAFGNRQDTCYVCDHSTSLAVCSRCDMVMLFEEAEDMEGKEYCRSCLEYITDDYWHDSAKEGRLR
jgi:hypothetical protein